MKHRWKALLLSALCVLLFGLLLTGIGVWQGGSLSFALTSNGYRDLEQTKDQTIEIHSEVKSVSVTLGSGDLKICPTERDYAYFETDMDAEYRLENGELQLTAQSLTGDSKWALNINFSGKELNTLTLYLPQDTQLNQAELSGGDIELNGLSCQTLSVTQSSGNFTGENLDCGRVTLQNGFGDVRLTDVTCSDLNAALTSGALIGENLSCARLIGSSDYGEVRLNSLSADSVSLHLETGDARLTSLSVSKQLRVESGYGDVTLETEEGADQYSCQLSTQYGDVIVSGKSYSGEVQLQQEDAPTLEVSAESGDIRVK